MQKALIMKLVECVPNFSEGRNNNVIELLAGAVEKVNGVKLLHKDIGYDANRTVFTLAGIAESVFEAAFNLVKIAIEKIDMRYQKGEHPRLGAVDVMPFIPISGITFEELNPMVIEFSKKIASELNLPVYLYEKSATLNYRKRLEQIRQGEFEGLANKMKSSVWTPDFGPSLPHPTAGAIATGVRNFLVAYNINLSTTDVEKAKKLAYLVRESGFVDRDGEQQYGLFNGVKAIGWYMEQYGCAQVSMNITDLNKSPVHVVHRMVAALANDFETTVTGAEVVGLIPENCLIEAGRFFHGGSDIKTDAAINLAIDMLGLNSVRPFDPQIQILENKLKDIKQ